MSKENSTECIERVELMASGDPTWDLSENDRRALTVVLEMYRSQKDSNIDLAKRLSDTSDIYEKALYLKDVTIKQWADRCESLEAQLKAQPKGRI